MLNQEQIIRTNHCRQGCVIPVGWVVESVLLILLVCAVRDLSVNVARIARTMELLEKTYDGLTPCGGHAARTSRAG